MNNQQTYVTIYMHVVAIKDQAMLHAHHLHLSSTYEDTYISVTFIHTTQLGAIETMLKHPEHRIAHTQTRIASRCLFVFVCVFECVCLCVGRPTPRHPHRYVTNKELQISTYSPTAVPNASSLRSVTSGSHA